jgi:hypothetical protein
MSKVIDIKTQLLLAGAKNEHRMRRAFDRAAMEVAGRDPDFKIAYDFVKKSRLLAKQPGGEDAIKFQYAKELSEEQRARVDQIFTVRGLMDQAAWHVTFNQQPNDREHNPYHFKTILKNLRMAGVTAEQVQEWFQWIWINMVATAHPVTYLDPKTGLPIYEDFMKGDNPYQIAERVFENNIRLAPERRATTLEEMDHLMHYAGLRYEGRHAAFAMFESDFMEVFGKRLRLWSRSHETYGIDTALRNWTGVDADGNPAAERWTMLMDTTLSVRHKLDKALFELDEAIKEGEMEAWKAQPLRDFVVSWRQGLMPIEEKLRKNLKEIMQASPQQRRALLEEREKLFESIKAEFAAVFKGKTFKGETVQDDPKHPGLVFCHAVHKEMERLYDYFGEQGRTKAQNRLNRALIDWQDGPVVSRPEARNNVKKQNAIVENLFRNEAFRRRLVELGVIKKELADHLPGLTTQDLFKRKIFEKIEDKMSAEELREFLYASNPIDYDKLGLPVQTHEYLQRCDTAKLSPMIFGPMSIIAESENGWSVAGQNFIFYAFGLDVYLKSTSLIENHKLLKLSHTMIPEANGKRNPRKKTFLEKYPWFARFEHPLVETQMTARSDTGRLSGILSFPLGLNQADRNAFEAAINNCAILFQEGMGFTELARGGGDPRMFLRMVVRALRRYQKLHPDKLTDDSVALIMTRLIGYTHQGAALYQTPDGIARDIGGMISEMMGLHFELKGQIKPGTFIPPDHEFSEKMWEFIEAESLELMVAYGHHQKAKVSPYDDDQPTLYNAVNDKNSNPEVSKSLNFASRPDSRDGKPADLSEQRAIGVVFSDRMARLHRGGWFTMGALLHRIHTAYQNGKLDGQDIRAFANDPFFRDFISRQLKAAAAFDIHHSLRRLETAETFTHEKLMAIGQSVSMQKIKTEGKERLFYESKFFEPDRIEFLYEPKFFESEHDANKQAEIAYVAQIYVDHCRLLAYAEALAAAKDFAEPKAFMAENAYETGKKKCERDGTFNFAIGGHTMKRYPEMRSVLKSIERGRVPMILLDAHKEHASDLKTGDAAKDEAAQRRAGTAWRAGPDQSLGPALKAYVSSWGRRMEPLEENILADAYRTNLSGQKPALDQPRF